MPQEETSNTRVRMNVSLTAKGLAQWDVTAEYADVETAKENLSKAIDAIREVLAEKKIPEAGSGQ